MRGAQRAVRAAASALRQRFPARGTRASGAHSRHRRRGLSTRSAARSRQKPAACPEQENPCEGQPVAIVWLSNLFPVKQFSWDIRPFFFNNHASVKLRLGLLVQKLATKDINIITFRTEKIEGGAFVRFQSSTKSPKEVAFEIKDYLMKHIERTMFVRHPVKAHLVEGAPWFHDMVFYPTKRVVVKTTAGSSSSSSLSKERLYDVLRQYGRISAMEYKALDKGGAEAVVQYDKLHGAISASKCAHRAVVGGAEVVLEYQTLIRASTIRDFIATHSRVLLPLAFSATVAVLYALFDPLRVFFVTNRITNRFDLRDMVGGGASVAGGGASDADAAAAVEGAVDESLVQRTRRRVTVWLSGFQRLLFSPEELLASMPVWSAESFGALTDAIANGQNNQVILLAGPTGCGKTTMLKEISRKSSVGLSLDFRDVGTDNTQILERLVEDTNFFPNLAWLHRVKALVEELIALGTRGAVAPSATGTAQHAVILNAVSSALAKQRKRRQQQQLAGGAGPAAGAEEVPLIVINGISSVFWAENEEFAPLLMSWAKTLVSCKLANVVIACEASVAESLADGSSRFRPVVLQDASHEKTVAFLEATLPAGSYAGRGELEAIASRAGGRLNDILAIQKRVAGGASLGDAYQDRLQGAVQLLRAQALGLGVQRELPWTRSQAWYLLTALSETGSLAYDDVLFSSLFAGDEQAIRSMQRADLIAVTRQAGPQGHVELRISYSRPLYQAAVSQMMGSRGGVGAGMNIELCDTLMASLKAQLRSYEEELALVANKGRPVQKRADYLASAISECTARLDCLRRDRAQHQEHLPATSFNA